MKPLDYLLQRWRYRTVAPYIPDRCALLDVGGYDGSLLNFLAGKLTKGICLDPLCRSRTEGRFHFVRGSADRPLPLPDASVDVVTLVAALEHIQEKAFLVHELFRVLKHGGRVVLTVPQPMVDKIIEMLIRVQLLDGMSLDEHHGFDPKQVIQLFGACGFTLIKHGRFQLGLNNLFVFEKRTGAQA